MILDLYRWIMEMEGSRLMKLQANDPNFIRDMERAVRVGDPVLLEVNTCTIHL